METAQGYTLQSLRSVQAFLTHHAAALPGVVHTGTYRQLVETLATLSALVAEQAGSDLAAQGATQRQRALRRALLRDHLTPIARIARVALSETPALEPLRLPRGRPTAEQLAAAAHGMAEAAAPYAELFVAAGLAADFRAQLHDAADALLASLDHRARRQGQRTGATAGLRATLSAGRKLVHVLDAFVQTALVDEPALLASWAAAQRVQRLPGRRSAPATTVDAIPEATASAISEATASAISEPKAPAAMSDATAAAPQPVPDVVADPRNRSGVRAADPVASEADHQQRLLRRTGHAARTRSIAVYQLPSRLTRFADGRLRSLFGGRTADHSERRE
jgi:hypothetical protein